MFSKVVEEEKDIVTGIVIVLAMGFVWAKSWSGYEKNSLELCCHCYSC